MMIFERPALWREGGHQDWRGRGHPDWRVGAARLLAGGGRPATGGTTGAGGQGPAG